MLEYTENAGQLDGIVDNEITRELIDDFNESAGKTGANLAECLQAIGALSATYSAELRRRLEQVYAAKEKEGPLG